MGFGVKLFYFTGANYLPSASVSKPAKRQNRTYFLGVKPPGF